MFGFLTPELFEQLHKLNDQLNHRARRAGKQVKHQYQDTVDTVQDWTGQDDTWESWLKKAGRVWDRGTDQLSLAATEVADTAQRKYNRLENEIDNFEFGTQDEADMGQFWKGLAAGVVGGLAATAVKSLWEAVAPVRAPEEETPPAILADRANMELRGEHLDEEQKNVAEQAIHWTFGTTTGAVYGLAAEATDAVTTGAGIPFGIALWAGTHVTSVPALGLEDTIVEKNPKYALSEFAGHLLYGLTAEVVRRGVRSVI